VFAVRAARAFDGDRFLHDGATVFVDDGRIAGVEGPHCDVPRGCELQHFDDATILPGLIDTHVHLVADSHDGALDRVPAYDTDQLDAVIDGGLARQLAAGVTTVRDLGDRSWCVVERRDRMSPHDLTPTIVASGPPITSVGGHCHFLGGAVDGTTAIAAAIRERAERGVDVVKVMASGGFNTPGTKVDEPQFPEDELRLLVDLAHAAGLRVVAHAHALSAVEQVIDVGADGIEHFSCMTATGMQHTDDVLQRVAAAGTPVSLTMGVDPAFALSPPPHIAAFLAERGFDVPMMLAQRQEAQERVCRSGVRLLCGTDAGIGNGKPHGILGQSVAEHVDRGLALPLALAGATSFAAEACGLASTKGRLRPGLEADLLVVAGDLATNVTALARPVQIWVRGQPTPRQPRHQLTSVGV
jgi:imidazolonepropionase-like amidohydrolase